VTGVIVQDAFAGIAYAVNQARVATPVAPDLEHRLDVIEQKLDRLLVALEEARATQTRTAFSVEEVAGLLGKHVFTVREWCRLGRINASKRGQRRGRVELWSIAAGEVERIKNEGLLPLDPSRNQV